MLNVETETMSPPLPTTRIHLPRRSKNIILTELRSADAPVMASILDFNSDSGKKIIPFTLSMPVPYQLCHAQEFMTMCDDRRKKEGRVFDFAIRVVTEVQDHDPTETFIGQASIMSGAPLVPADPSLCAVDLGYWLHPDYWGSGIITEVNRVLTNLAFEIPQVERVALRVFADNIGSCRVAEKRGFTLEGVHRRAVRTKLGIVKDIHVYGKLRSEWEKE
ncbi:acyl-CoA N-acyltransferase [Phlyctochytrium arcticum]|nr:acyl-CoA N-acyltransferase [Phlyctochytrium arcticum]